MKKKICSKCKKRLPSSEFNKGKDRDGLVWWCKSCCKNYRGSHKKEIAKTKKEYYLKNKEKILNQMREYYSTHEDDRKIYNLSPIRIYSVLKRKKRNIKFNIAEKDFVNWYTSQEQICHYCGRTLEEIKEKFKNRMSIDRKDNNKGYSLDNIVLACFRCNYIKGDYFTEEEMIKISKFIKNNIKRGGENE